MKNRGEKSDHFDFLEWEKGREAHGKGQMDLGPGSAFDSIPLLLERVRCLQVSFNAASTFLYKISGGNIGVWRSKDSQRLSLSPHEKDD